MMIKRISLALSCSAFLTTGHAQTSIDLRTQTKSVDFGRASYTKPVKTGTTLPPTCTVAELFFLTTAAPGRNLYLCSLPNFWTVITPAIAVPDVTNSAGQVLSTNGSLPEWRTLGGDVNGSPESLRVTALQGLSVATTAPSDGQALRWDYASRKWGPAADSVLTVFGRKGSISEQAGDYNFPQISGIAPISQGGTGASSGAEAISNLGAAAAAHSHAWADISGVTGQHGAGSLVQVFAGGSVNANDCAKFDGSGNLVSSGAPCGSGTGSGLPEAGGQPNMLLGTDGSSANWRGIGTGLLLTNTSLAVDGSTTGLLGGTNEWTEQNAFHNGHIVAGEGSYSDHSGAGWTAPIRTLANLPNVCHADIEWVTNNGDGHTYRCDRMGTGWLQQDGGGSPPGLDGQITYNNASAFGAKPTTGTGAVVLATSPTLVTPNITDLTNAAHNHSDAAGGGNLTASAISRSARQGNGTVFQMASGNPTPGNCAEFDANGNIVDAGNPCGSGSGTGTVTESGFGVGRATLSATWANLIPDGACDRQTATWTGVTISDTVAIGAPATATWQASGWVSAADTVTVQLGGPFRTGAAPRMKSG
jgi:hypothetical protein